MLLKGGMKLLSSSTIYVAMIHWCSSFSLQIISRKLLWTSVVISVFTRFKPGAAETGTAMSGTIESELCCFETEVAAAVHKFADYDNPRRGLVILVAIYCG